MYSGSTPYYRKPETPQKRKLVKEEHYLSTKNLKKIKDSSQIPSEDLSVGEKHS